MITIRNKSILLILILFFIPTWTLAQAKVIEFTIPISIRKNNLTTPDLPCIDKKAKGEYFYGLEGSLRVQKNGFTANLLIGFWKRQGELKKIKNAEKLNDSIFLASFELEKLFFNSLLFSRFKTNFFMENFSPFYYLPVSMAYNSYLALDYIYTERRFGLDIGLFLGKPVKSYIVFGSHLGHFLRKGKAEEKNLFEFVYPEASDGFFAFGPFILIRIKNIFNLPIACSFNFEEVGGLHSQEVISKYSGIVEVYIKKSIGVFIEGVKETNNSRENSSIELGIKFFQ